MIRICKGEPPEELVRLQEEAQRRGLDPVEAYKLLKPPLKGKVLRRLQEEQGFLCAYCMHRIPDERDLPEGVLGCTIEHYVPRRPTGGRDVGQGLDYGNMLAVCSGNRGRRHDRRRRDLTCDARRSVGAELTVNPLVEQTLASIFYVPDGSIDATDPMIRDDLVNKLNLNCASEAVQLPMQRQAALLPVQEAVAQLVGEGQREHVVSECARLLARYEREQVKTEYVGIIIWWLKDFLKDIE